MAGTLVIISTALIGALWIFAQWRAAGREFADPAIRRNWVVAASLLFLALLSFTLAAGASGVLARFERMPYPAFGIFPFIVASSCYLAFSRFGTLLVKHIPLSALIAWNAMALVFLLVIAFIAITSFPTPLRVFTEEPSNLWVTRLPYTLLPGVLVTAALTGQILIFRKLKFSRL